MARIDTKQQTSMCEKNFRRSKPVKITTTTLSIIRCFYHIKLINQLVSFVKISGANWKICLDEYYKFYIKQIESINQQV